MIKNYNVVGLEQSIISSALSMNPTVDTNRKMNEKDIERAIKLASVQSGSGHDCYMKGITVLATIEVTHTWQLQFMRYHFADIISSSSKMHSIINKFDKFVFDKNVSKIIIDNLKQMIEQYKKNKDNYSKEENNKKLNEIYANIPMGTKLRLSIVTNYLQLKTIWFQRRHHKLEEWQTFCDWIETLPYMKKFLKIN